MEYFTLTTGAKMPMAGIGTFMISPADAEVAVESALRSGVRLIDTANAYMNESATGRGIKNSGVAREEIFLVSKLWPTVYAKETAVDEMLSRLGTDYVDLLFLHQPTDNWREGYKNIEKAVREGKVRSIGLSNFTEEEVHEAIDTLEIKPQLVQSVRRNGVECYGRAKLGGARQTRGHEARRKKHLPRTRPVDLFRVHCCFSCLLAYFTP